MFRSSWFWTPYWHPNPQQSITTSTALTTGTCRQEAWAPNRIHEFCLIEGFEFCYSVLLEGCQTRMRMMYPIYPNVGTKSHCLREYQTNVYHAYTTAICIFQTKILSAHTCSYLMLVATLKSSLISWSPAWLCKPAQLITAVWQLFVAYSSITCCCSSPRVPLIRVAFTSLVTRHNKPTR